MKKIVTFVLMISLLVGLSMPALAADDNAVISTGNANSNDKNDTGSGSVNTELWLQVDASGQIDVTVPLVLVFQTNIDGGKATSPNTYKITNRSTAPIAVTEIKTTVEPKSAENPMELAAYNAALAQDQYKVRLSAPVGQSTGSWDLFTPTHTALSKDGGLFKVGNNGSATQITADMETGPLTFVTARDNTDQLDQTKGIKLLNVQYTVALDTSAAIGETITNTDSNTTP